MFIATKKTVKKRSFEQFAKDVREDLGSLDNLKAKDYDQYGLPTFAWEKTLSQLARIPLIRNEEGKISLKQTLAGINDGDNFDGLPGKEIKWVVAILAHITSPKSVDPKWSRLSPLVMMAFKKYANIGYEEWDKKDEQIKFALGTVLYRSIYIDVVNNPDAYASAYSDPSSFREKLLTTNAGERRLATQYMGYNKTVDGHNWKGPDPVKYMIAQIWHGHHSLRSEYMILDVNDWDLMPEPLDEIADSIEDVSVDSDLPW